jgi:glutamine synthetase
VNDIEQVRAAVERGEVHRIRIEIPDTDGNLRGKYVSPAKLLKGSGAAVSDVFYTLSVADDVFEAPVTGVATGFPDVVAQPDWSTARLVPWQPGVLSVIGAMQTKAGEPHPIDPRGATRRAEERAAALGFEARVGTEYEIYLFEGGASADAAIRAGRHRDLVPLGREWQAYSLWRFADGDAAVLALDAALRGFGIEMEAWSTELGRGMVECATPPLPPVAAADLAARAKLAIKEVARGLGLIATFIAKWDMAQSGSSGHLHQSLARDGENAFWAGGPDVLSITGRHYLGGLVTCAPALSAFATPFVNSYRRPSPELWAPTNASWGWDNRQAAIRAITSSRAATRLEYRRPGADLNPYLAIAACIDSGLHGIREQIEPPRASVGAAFDDPTAGRYPSSLTEAADLLEASTLARGWYGDDLVDHYVTSRRAEAETVRRLADAQVPAHELVRYFETT